MLLETMIVSLCLGGYECSKAPQAYYLSNHNLRTWAKLTKDRYKEKIQQSQFETPIVVGLGAAFIVLGGKPRVKITNNISLKMSREKNEIVFTYAF